MSIDVARPPRSEEILAERLRRRNRSIGWHAAVGLAVAVTLIALWPHRQAPNPEYAAALERIAQFDALFESARAGELTVTEEPSAVWPAEPSELDEGITGAAVTRGARELVVLVGRAEHKCYSLWWDEEFVRHGRVLASDLACEPTGDASSTARISFERSARVQSDPDAPFDWTGVLPPEIRLHYWFLPVQIAGIGIVVAALSRIIVMLITRQPV